MKLVTVEEMKAIEKEADAGGLSYDQMMENAGRGLAELLLDLVDGGLEGLEVFGLVGAGNNGGDTLVALAELARRGWKARAYLIKRKQDALVKRLLDAGGDAASASEDKEFKALATLLRTADVLLDGVLGTGIKLPLKEEIGNILAESIYVMADMPEPPLVVAVDCPSGVDCDTGEAADECIPADLTITMAAVKQGLLRLPAFEYVGELKVVDIGLPEDLQALQKVGVEIADEEMIAALLPDRPVDAHKGTFGTALIAAGSLNYTGAALLAGQAAYRIGAGLVTLAVPAPLHTALAGQFPEATWVLLPHELGVISRSAIEVLAKNYERATALLVGPGLGMEDTTRDFVEALVSRRSVSKKSGSRIGFVHYEAESQRSGGGELPPLVIDADGLTLLAQIKDWHAQLPAPAILTPHPGEMAALTGFSKEEIQENRQPIASKCAVQWGHVVVLKGAFTVVAAPDGRTVVVPVASSALARAGTGDVLAGLIVGLRAQGLEAFDAAVAGAWIHARAGLYAADDLGTTASVLAGDLLGSISDVISDLL
jgi:hydroxyethylthiazole kinase-like uncharacterized protein yjeF